MTKMKAKPRGGPRTVNRKVKPASVRVEDFAPADAVDAIKEIFASTPEREAEHNAKYRAAMDEAAKALNDYQPSPPPVSVPFAPQPSPWSCQCGVDRNSALVEECPVCKTKRPYEYTAPEPVLAVPSDYPQPGESMEDYARRMQDKPQAERDRDYAEWDRRRYEALRPPSDADLEAEIQEIEAKHGKYNAKGRQKYKAKRLAEFAELHPVDPGRARELPDPKGLYAKGYASPISFAGPIGSVDVDPLVLQMALDVANKAAQTGIVQSVTVGLKGPSQARVIVRFDLDVASVPWPRAVKDEG
jgi:hypothetical protein